MHVLRLTALPVVFALSATAVAAQSDRDRRADPVVVTNGSAVVRLPPDRAFLVLATELRARTPSEAQQQAAQAMTAVRQKLKAAGVEDEAVRTLSFTLREEFDFIDNRRTSRGYVAANTIEVRVDRIERVGPLLDAAVQGGATTVNEIRFDLKDRDAAERRALRLAVEDARARAEAVAAGAGRTLGAIVRIDEQGAVFPPPRPFGAVAMREMAAAADTPVAPGELEVRATVTLTVSLQ